MARATQLTENQKAFMRMTLLSALLERARNLELARIGLNIPQAEVLYCVKMSKEPVTPMKLAHMLYKQPHTVSALVHRMEKQGLLSTKNDMKRKNWLRVSLTKKGEETMKLWHTVTEVPDIMSSLSEKETQEFYAITKKLHSKGLEVLRKMQSNPYAEPLFW